MKIYYAKVLKNDLITDDVYDLHLHAPEQVQKAKVGQFLSIYTGSEAMLLPRPLSICEIDTKNGVFRVVYKAIGAGTQNIASFKPGDQARLLGAHGSSYKITDGHKKFAIVGGGLGVPPMLALAQKIRAEVPEAKISVFLGFRSKEQVILDKDFETVADEVHVATDDGSFGTKGNAIELLRAHGGSNADTLFGCGPHIMLKFLFKFADEFNLPCHVSIEERMACTVGACLACVCKIVWDSPEGFAYRRVCSTGPVFNAKELVWE